jgi:hypothetical protein
VVEEPARKPEASGYMSVAIVACVLLGLFGLVPFFMAPGSVFGISFIAALLLLLPAWLMGLVGGAE